MASDVASSDRKSLEQLLSDITHLRSKAAQLAEKTRELMARREELAKRISKSER